MSPVYDDGGGGGGGNNAWRRRAMQHARRAFMHPQGPIAPPPVAPPPQAPQPPVGSQIPNSGIYLQRQAQAEQAYQQALAQIAQRKQQTFRDYGFLENGQVDPNASHGQIQELWRNQAADATQGELSMLGRGIKGGLAGQALTARRGLFGGQNLQLQNSYTDVMQGLANDRTQAESTRNDALLAAQQEAMQQAIQDDQHTPAQAPGEEPPEPAPLPGRPQARRHLARALARRQGHGRGGRRRRH